MHVVERAGKLTHNRAARQRCAGIGGDSWVDEVDVLDYTGGVNYAEQTAVALTVF